MADSKPMSLRLPVDLVDHLADYATANGLFRDGQPNISGAIVNVLRDFFTVSDNVIQLHDSDVESRLQNLITPLIARIESLENALSEVMPPPSKVIQSESEYSLDPIDDLPIIQAIEAVGCDDDSDIPTEISEQSKSVESSGSDLSRAEYIAKRITYDVRSDCSIVLRTVRGCTVKELKKMNDEQLKVLGIVRVIRFGKEVLALTDSQAKIYRKWNS